MARYRHPTTGVVVSVPDDLAATLAAGFEPVDREPQREASGPEPEPEPTKPRRRRVRSDDDE